MRYFSSRGINECKVTAQFLVPPWDMFMVEFDKQQWTFFCIFLLSAGEHVPFQDAFREGGRTGKKMESLFPVISIP